MSTVTISPNQANVVNVVESTSTVVSVSAIGPIGPQGFTGASGSQGPQGIQGETGPQGSQGVQGEQGSQGEQGPQGIQGETGPSGSQGPQGETGPSGSQGPQGIQGEPGLVDTGSFATTGSNTFVGNQKIETPDPATDFTAIDFRNTTNFGIYGKSNSIAGRGNTLEFTATDYNINGDVLTHEVLTLHPEGRVGIGTNNPSSELEIIGDQSITGSLNISGSISVSTAEDGELIIGSNGIITATLGDITIEPFDDLLLYGGDSLIAANEGGDVVLRAGVGPDEVDGVISTGGDVTIAGGNGGSGSIDSGGNGGNVNIYGGDSETEIAGGQVRIYGGFGYDNYANVVIGANDGGNNWEFNQNTGELLAPLWTVDRGTFYLDTSTQDQKIYFGPTSNASYIGTTFGNLKLYNTGSNLEIESENVNITGSLHISGSGSLNGNNIVSSNTIQKIETITSASYAALTPPVSGTLYIVID